ncbi:MAG: cytochrome-c peroxidase [wastewater metagenome]|nr:cytochrome-c peroxidase [Candidatus Loosdrechtia aerotolerans]
MIKNVFIISVVFFSLVSAARADSPMERAQIMFKPIPKDPPPLEGNPVTPEKVNLGKILYFDPRLSASNLISCNTCHNIGMGGIDFQETSIGHGWQKGHRNAPTVFNAVFNIAQFWDGRASDLREQAKGPVQATVEMNNTPEIVIETIRSMPEYEELFKKAFSDEKDPVTFDNMARAIEAFEVTLLTPDSRFDGYLKGDENALTAKEREGLRLFMQKGCALCHGGINIGGQGYYPFGVVEKPGKEIAAGDVGRFSVTGVKADEYVFKAPSLRNIALTPPYFHSGKVWGLKDAVKIMGAVQLGISLAENEADNIVAFLKTTTGVQPKVEYPILPASTDKTPRPKPD